MKTPTATDSAGKYVMPFLVPDQYEITVQAKGFKEAKRTDLALGADEHPVIDLKLEVGDVSTQVTVAADVLLLNTDNASVGQAISTKQVEDMPLNGRTPPLSQVFALIEAYCRGILPAAFPQTEHWHRS